MRQAGYHRAATWHRGLAPRSSSRSVSGRRGRRDALGAIEDIPLARRSQTSIRADGRSTRRLALLALVVGGVAALALWPNGPLRRASQPSPVPGLQSRPSGDGRLLNHFPYPEAAAAELSEVSPGLLLRPEAARSLQAMIRDAAAQGVRIQVLSAFRSLKLQRELFFDVKSERNQSARARARVSAPPGYSEHSTGYAVDLGDASRPDLNLKPDFDTSAAFRWLQANAQRYHFQLSFPRDNTQGVSYEPWHWRFEGSTAALRLFEPAQRFAR